VKSALVTLEKSHGLELLVVALPALERHITTLGVFFQQPQAEEALKQGLILKIMDVK